MAQTGQEYGPGAEYKNVQQPDESYAANYGGVAEPTYPESSPQDGQYGYDAQNNSYGGYTNDEATNYAGGSYAEPGGAEDYNSSGEAAGYGANEGYSGEHQYSGEAATRYGSESPGGDDYEPVK